MGAWARRRHGAAMPFDGRLELVRIAQARLSGLAGCPAVHVRPQATYGSGRRPADQPAQVTGQLSVDDPVRTDEVLGDAFAPRIPASRMSSKSLPHPR